ncbi:hypothetical protein [Hyalangium gracile]|uniref:hypothetical protein n=1 Tax=Hyalangium gracile TaxID=394092 RepID=UPI001CCA3BB2|nr:hypothetical protein [Hyalangium gracile]
MRPSFLVAALLLLASGCATTPAAANVPGLDPELRGYAYPFTVHELEFESQRQPLRMAYMDERPADWQVDCLAVGDALVNRVQVG